MLSEKLNGFLNKRGGKRYSHISWFSTLLFNLRCFDFKTALKLPVYIYNNVDVFAVNKVIIDSPEISRGMIRIGIHPCKAHNNFKIWFSGTILFHGAVELGGGCIIEGDGLLEFGDNVILAESCKIMCCEHIKFNDHINVGYETTIMDTDYHYTMNTQTYKVHSKKAPVIIGEGTWISSACRVMKGSVLPPKSIVSGGSLINKDFSKEEPCQVYVGTPAKPIKGNTRRIVNREKEHEIDMYFEQYPEEKTLTLEVDDIDAFCWDHFFR